MIINDFIKKWLTILGPLILGTIVGLLTSMDNFKYLNKPPLNPPGWLFPVVWSILYLLMGISFYLALKNGLNEHQKKIYYTQLTINLIWPFLFFNFELYTFSAIWLILLIITVIIMIKTFFQIKKLAGILQIPYFIWLLFALYLNVAISILN